MKMRAIVFEKYGSPDVLELREVDRPSPGANEVLVEVFAASVNAYDWHLVRAKPFLVRLGGMGFFKPNNTGTGADLAGRVAEVGPGVEGFKVGDDVYGEVSQGAFAEYVCVKVNQLAPKPESLSFEEAAAVPMAGVTALQGLRDIGGLKSGQQVLINGASGGVGTFGVQIAKAMGAVVTAVCSSAKADQARDLGADHVIDYTREDFTKSGRQYDLILGVNGFQPLSAYKRALTKDGSYVMAGGTNAQIFQALLLGGFSKRTKLVSSKVKESDLLHLCELIKAGQVKPVIDRRYPLEQVPDAIAYVDEGHASGKVVITVKE